MEAKQLYKPAIAGTTRNKQTEQPQELYELKQYPVQQTITEEENEG
jgi:hypothetical protein